MQARDIPAPRLAANLKRALAESNVTQEALAREIGVGLRTVQNWTSGARLPYWTHLVLVARALGRDPAWFYADHAKEKAAA